MAEPPKNKPIRVQERFGIPRYCWLPLCAFLGGSLIFLIVDLVCFLAGHGIHHIPDLPR